jgi:hypothetical protein
MPHLTLHAALGSVRRTALLLPLVLFSLLANAQQSPNTIVRLSPEDQTRGLNGMQKNFFFSTGLGITENEYKSAGFFGQNLRPYLAGNQEALKELNNYRRQKWMFLAERMTFVGAVGLYGQQVLAKPEVQQYSNNTQKVAIGVAAVSLLSNIFITRHTNEHFQRAVEAHNAGLPAARTGALQQLRPSAVGLTASQWGQPQVALSWNLR